MRFHWKAGLLAACALLSFGCGNSNGYSTAPGGGTVPPGATGPSVTVGKTFFHPAATTVAVGSTVTWTWAGGVRHNVTFDDGVASATQATGTYSRTFNTAGTYSYHCTIHGTMMSGTVTVH